MSDDKIFVSDILSQDGSSVEMPISKLCDFVLKLGKIGITSVNVSGGFSSKYKIAIMFNHSVYDKLEELLTKSQLYLDETTIFSV